MRCWLACEIGEPAATAVDGALLLMLLLVPFCCCCDEMTLGLMAPPMSWLNWRELAALIGTDGCDLRPVAGIEPAS